MGMKKRSGIQWAIYVNSLEDPRERVEGKSESMVGSTFGTNGVILVLSSKLQFLNPGKAFTYLGFHISLGMTATMLDNTEVGATHWTAVAPAGSGSLAASVNVLAP